MPTPPHRLQPDTSLADNLAYINDNFDKVVSDMGDLGARFSSIGTYSVTIAADSMHTQSVTVTDNRPQYGAGRIQIVPRAEVFVDNDANDAYLLGYSGSLSAGQKNALLSVTIQRRAAGTSSATFTVQIKNFDVAPHTYYVYVDESYISSPPSGYFK